MPVPIIPVSISAVVKNKAKNNAKKLAEIRNRILSLLLNNKALVDGILGRQEDREKLSDEQLSAQTLEIKNLLDDLHAADLAAAQQLAQNRFKEATDLREILRKAQPELRACDRIL